jgi:glyoxylase-like metal-dependent hydrolase (beta-lactamase superfamily II)
VSIRIDRIRTGITNSYLLRGDGAVLIDPGEPGRGTAVLRKLAAVIDDVGEIGLILATHGHYDHIGAAPALVEATGARLAMHRSDDDWARSGGFVTLIPTTRWGRFMFTLLSPMSKRIQRKNPVKADIVFDDAGIDLHGYGIDARIVATPGHTPGSVSVLLDGGDAIVGDLAINGPPLSLKPSLSAIAVDPDQMRESWQHLVELGATTAHPAHGKPFGVGAINA